MGILIIGLVIWVMRVERRTWVKNLAWSSLVLVIIQGLMGGYRVTELSIVLAIIHGCTAQLFFCLMVLMAMALSPEWDRPLESRITPARVASLKSWSWAVVGAIFIQLVLGAVMRHLDAGLAIPTFPLTPEGTFMPREHNMHVDIHFAHRFWAIIVTLLVGVLVTKVFRNAASERRFSRPALTLVALLVIQIALGAAIIFTQRASHPTTSHVVNGALVLGLGVLLAIRSNRFSALDSDQPHHPFSTSAAPAQA
jgi:cytochrome c oxidase assembly protein subunit 15